MRVKGDSGFESWVCGVLEDGACFRFLDGDADEDASFLDLRLRSASAVRTGRLSISIASIAIVEAIWALHGACRVDVEGLKCFFFCFRRRELFFFSFGFWYDERGRRWTWAVTGRDYLGNCSFGGLIVVNAKWRLEIYLLSFWVFCLIWCS